MNKRRYKFTLLMELILSAVISFIWVGSYGYTYNIDYFNSSPVNWLAFLLWAWGLFFTIQIYRFFGRYLKSLWLSLTLTWLVYFTGLLVIEYIGYYVLTIRQITPEGPLLFGLIHGPMVLKVYYIIAGISAVFLCNILNALSTSLTRRRHFVRNSQAQLLYEYGSNGKNIRTRPLRRT
ncbi:MAG: hypothetical protein C0392_08120 [Syntrophus sp. (in: bacteria)]|nr:hypothetical protein [Syntrophus sp. (in: bacteria)]